MQVFIANIDSISKTPDVYSALLWDKHKSRLSKFQNQTRKLQFILGHLMADNCGKTYTSIAHKDKWVVVASDMDTPVGIDIENTSVERDFVGAAELMHLTEPKSLNDFYKSFTKAEAIYKLGTAPKCTHFIQFGNYLICVTSIQDFDTPQLEHYDVSACLFAEKE